MITAEEKKQKLWAGVGTGLFHVLLLLLMLMRCSSPPPGGGDNGPDVYMMDFGHSDAGSGEVEADDEGNEQSEEASAPQETNTAEVQEEKVLTSTESDVAVPTNKKKKVEKKEEVTEKEPERQPNPNISKLGKKLNHSNSKKSGGDGDDGKPGNTGDPSGVPDGGGGGSGFGPSGISDGASISGWKLLNQAKYKEKFTESGRIVLDIIIDDNGNIVEVKKGRGSTTSSSKLFEIAKKRAFELKFSPIGGKYKAYKGSYTVDFEVN